MAEHRPYTFSPGSTGFRSQSSGSSTQIGTGLGAAPSGHGIYDVLFANNPYRNLNYNKSSWQEFLSWLGFRTDADRFQEEAQMNALQTDFGIYQQMYQDEYNSETAKAARMRAAGENPDLLGTGQVSEASSPVEDPQGMSPGATEEGVLGQVTSGVISAFNTAFGMASQLLQLDGMRSDIEGKNVSNAEQMMNVIQQRVLGLTPAEGFKTDEEFAAWKKKTELQLRNDYGRAFFKGSSLRRWNRSIDDFIGTLPTSRDQYDAWRQRLGSAKDYLVGRETFWDEALDVFRTINQWRFELREATEKNTEDTKLIESEAAVETAANELEYQTHLQPGERARAQNEEWRRQAEGETFSGIINKHLAKLGTMLDELSQQGGLRGLLSEILIFILSARGSVNIGQNGASVSLTPPSPVG